MKTFSFPTVDGANAIWWQNKEILKVTEKTLLRKHRISWQVQINKNHKYWSHEICDKLLNGGLWKSNFFPISRSIEGLYTLIIDLLRDWRTPLQWTLEHYLLTDSGLWSSSFFPVISRAQPEESNTWIEWYRRRAVQEESRTVGNLCPVPEESSTGEEQYQRRAWSI